MRLFLQLTTLPADTEDLVEIIDTAGDFLINQDDAEHAGQLYAAAARAYPNVAAASAWDLASRKPDSSRSPLSNIGGRLSWNRRTTCT